MTKENKKKDKGVMKAKTTADRLKIDLKPLYRI